MSGPPSSRTPLRGARGAVTWVTMLLLVIVAAVGYFGWIYAPLYLDNFAVRQAVRATMNEAVKNPDDASLITGLCEKIRSIRFVDGVDAMGRTVPVPAVTVDERAVTWTREANRTPPTLRVSFEYEREVVYPFINRTGTKVFEVDETNDLTRPDWGPH